MRVTAQLFNPPGRGEFLQRVLLAPEHTMPTNHAEFLLRSVRAIKHFWPSATVPKATGTRQAPGCTVVDSGTWQVTWESDSYASNNDLFKARFAACDDGCNQELFTRAAAFTE